MSRQVVALFVIAVLAFVVAMPIAAIWSLNTLFGTEIVVSARTWLAALVAIIIVAGSSSRS